MPLYIQAGVRTGVQENAADVAAFHEQKTEPPPEAEGSILVIQANGKGIPMVRAKPAPQAAQRGKGKNSSPLFLLII